MTLSICENGDLNICSDDKPTYISKLQIFISHKNNNLGVLDAPCTFNLQDIAGERDWLYEESRSFRGAW